MTAEEREDESDWHVFAPAPEPEETGEASHEHEYRLAKNVPSATDWARVRIFCACWESSLIISHEEHHFLLSQRDRPIPARITEPDNREGTPGLSEAEDDFPTIHDVDAAWSEIMKWLAVYRSRVASYAVRAEEAAIAVAARASIEAELQRWMGEVRQSDEHATDVEQRAVNVKIRAEAAESDLERVRETALALTDELAHARSEAQAQYDTYEEAIRTAEEQLQQAREALQERQRFIHQVQHPRAYDDCAQPWCVEARALATPLEGAGE